LAGWHQNEKMKEKKGREANRVSGSGIELKTMSG
jgi:hypothetical protein